MPTIVSTPASTPEPGKNNEAKKSRVNSRYKITGNNELDQYEVNDILADIAKRISDGRRLIIPIGMPQSGKSMFIASLIAYAFRRNHKQDNSCNFSVLDRGEAGVNAITNALDNNQIVPTTNVGTFTILDLDMESNYRKGKKVKISLVDLSGEDIERLICTRKDAGKNVEKIQGILNGCIAQRAIFCVISPVDEGLLEVGQRSDFDVNEDSRMKEFIDYIKLGNPNLYKRTKILMVVTKWDKVPSRISTTEFLSIHRNQLYNEYSGNSKSYGLLPYSVGNVESKTIMNISLHSPKNFWYTLYRWCTGKHVLPWWKRLFS